MRRFLFAAGEVVCVAAYGLWLVLRVAVEIVWAVTVGTVVGEQLSGRDR